MAKIELYNIDCMEYLKTLEDNAYELAIVDPPYGIGMGGSLNVNSKNNYNDKGKEWDSIRPNLEYFTEVQRVSNNQIIWGWNYYTDLLPPAKAFIYWDKMNHHENRSSGELAYCSMDKLARHFKYMWDGNRYGFIDGIQGVGKKSIRIHPTQKPVKLYEWLLMNYANEGDKILDTHLGSGSIAIACHNLNYDLVGCELDTDYYNSACKRLKQHQAQLTIF
tara:strand:- start:44 stop:703 length:660 start_codon:yes stop_codon:yes gene_type:complete